MKMKLTKRQKQILLFIADGYDSKQISDVIGITQATVFHHRKNLIAMFRARNGCYLMIFAMRAGYLE